MSLEYFGNELNRLSLELNAGGAFVEQVKNHLSTANCGVKSFK